MRGRYGAFPPPDKLQGWEGFDGAEENVQKRFRKIRSIYYRSETDVNKTIRVIGGGRYERLQALCTYVKMG